MTKSIITGLLFIFLLASSAATNAQSPFQKIVFHASRCFGTCPQIDLQLDSNRNIYVNRQFFTSKGEQDKVHSGQFTGVLDNAAYKQLVKILAASDIEHWSFPDIDCCDGAITTLIIYRNNKRTYLKSMTPPQESAALISFLSKIGQSPDLSRTFEQRKLEE